MAMMVWVAIFLMSTGSIAGAGARISKGREPARLIEEIVEPGEILGLEGLERLTVQLIDQLCARTAYIAYD